MNFTRILAPVVIVVCAIVAAPAMAQDASAGKGLSIELNALTPSEKGCKLTFLAQNDLPQGLTKASFEFVLFDEKGLVERMAVLDFRDLPAGKSKVRQFDLAGTRCESIKSVLINDAAACTGEGVARDACMSSLKTGSKSGVELKG